MGKFNCVTECENDQKVFKITWKCDTMDRNIYMELSRHVRVSTNYSTLNAEGMAYYRSLLAKWNRKYRTRVTMAQLQAARYVLLKKKIIARHNQLNSDVARATDDYVAGADIVDLSHKYDYAPMILLRGIFLYRKYNDNLINSIFKNRDAPTILLEGRDLEQFERAVEFDAESIINQQRIAEIAAENERRVGEFFRNLGIATVLQDELVEAQMAELGRAVITPDYLFRDKVYINGNVVNWIDFKDYIGTDVFFLRKSNENQAKKYNAEYGPGAMLYHHGFVSNFTIAGTMLLNASAMPLYLI